MKKKLMLLGLFALLVLQIGCDEDDQDFGINPVTSSCTEYDNFKKMEQLSWLPIQKLGIARLGRSDLSWTPPIGFSQKVYLSFANTYFDTTLYSHYPPPPTFSYHKMRGVENLGDSVYIIFVKFQSENQQGNNKVIILKEYGTEFIDYPIGSNQPIEVKTDGKTIYIFSTTNRWNQELAQYDILTINLEDLKVKGNIRIDKKCLQ